MASGITDNDIIIKAARDTEKIITVEEHSPFGGLGAMVAQVTAANYPVKVLRIGTNDEFGQSGEQRALMDFYGLTGEKLAQTILNELKKGN